MSIIILATFLVLTLAQLIFWEQLGEAFGYAASISLLGLFASVTLIVMARVAATRTFFDGRGR
jgi:ABC-type sulfate transport system permease component